MEHERAVDLGADFDWPQELEPGAGSSHSCPGVERRHLRDPAKTKELLTEQPARQCALVQLTAAGLLPVFPVTSAGRVSGNVRSFLDLIF